MTETASAIRFDRAKHRCYLGDEGLQSVGTILRNASKAFNPWQVDDVTPEARARMDRGKVIHETLEHFDNGTLEQYDPQCEPFILGMKKLKEHLGIERWEAVEEWKASEELRYWGIVDRGTPTWTYDVKTGKSRPSSYRLQVAGYCLLRGTPSGAVVYLPDDGQFDPKRDIEPVTEEDFEAFKMALKLAPRGKR